MNTYSGLFPVDRLERNFFRGGDTHLEYESNLSTDFRYPAHTSVDTLQKAQVVIRSEMEYVTSMSTGYLILAAHNLVDRRNFGTTISDVRIIWK